VPEALRVVADPNILVSAAIASGNPQRIVDLAALGAIQLVACPHLLNELEAVLARDRFLRWRTREQLDRFVADLRILPTAPRPDRGAERDARSQGRLPRGARSLCRRRCPLLRRRRPPRPHRSDGPDPSTAPRTRARHELGVRRLGDQRWTIAPPWTPRVGVWNRPGEATSLSMSRRRSALTWPLSDARRFVDRIALTSTGRNGPAAELRAQWSFVE
jgi:hypothetical protein